MAVLGIFLALGLLIFVAYRGYPVIVFAPIFAVVAAVLAGYPALPTYTDLFMVKAVAYVKIYFPIFLLGAVFGKVMEESGAAASIARGITSVIGPRFAILAVVLTCAVLTYGGVSLFVVAFAVYPFAAVLFREANIPKRLIPVTIALGSFTFTMDALPGSPQIQNIIPTAYFGTDADAAPVIGIIGALFVGILGFVWITYRKNKLMSLGEGYGEHTINEPVQDVRILPPTWLAILPLILVLGLNLFITRYDIVLNLYSPADLAMFKDLKLESVKAIWALIIALLTGILVTIGIFIAYGRKNEQASKGNKKFMLSSVLTAGAVGSLLAILNTASEVGFGNVIASLPSFKEISNFLLSMNVSPLVSEALSINVLAGITGSASGGMSIALDTMGAQYLEWAKTAGISPELLHRIASMSAGGMDTLPHNGAVITLLAICGLTHRQSYPDIFAITTIKTLAVPFVILIALATGWV